MFHPEPERSQSDCGQEVSGGLVVSGCDGSEVLELVEEALDEVALSVDFAIDGAAYANVALAGDVGVGALFLDELDDGLGVVATIGDDIALELEAVEQLRGCRLVGGLARGEDEAHRQAAAIDDDVDLGAQSAPRSSEGVIRAPFFPPAAC